MSEPDKNQSPIGDATATLESVTGMPPAPALDVEPPPPPAPAPPTGVNVPKNAKGRTDANGRGFDPDLHEVDKATGNARLRRDGRLMFKRGNNLRARDKATVADPPPGSEQAQPAEVERMPEEEDPVERADRAAAVVDWFECGATMLMGPEWKLDQDERERLARATNAVFEKYGSMVLPPEGMVAIALGGIAMTRISMPETQKRLGRIKGFFQRGGASAPRVVDVKPVPASPSAGASSSAAPPAASSES